MSHRDDNPYASPRTAGNSSADADVNVEVVGENEPWPWRWKDSLLVPDAAALAPLCVKCGRPTDRPLQPHNVAWINPLMLFLIGLLAVLSQQRGTLFIALCEEHEARRKRFRTISWSLAGAAVVQFIVGIGAADAFGSKWPLLLGITALVSLFAAALVHAVGGRIVNIERMEKGVIWIKGLPRPFYEDLPQLPSKNGRQPLIPDFE